MAVKTYGTLDYDQVTETWYIKAQPHVCIKLKHIFPQIPKTKRDVIPLVNRADTATDLDWFMERYPLERTDVAAKTIVMLKNKHISEIGALEEIFLPTYESKVSPVKIPLRAYQETAVDFLMATKCYLNGDDLGLGKTIIAIGAAARGLTPAIIVVQTHLQTQWEARFNQFTDLRVHKIKGTRPYSLPEADVYIIKYSCIAGWTDVITNGFFKFAVFDEIQEIRKKDSEKSIASKGLAHSCEYVLGLSATPIYNYADEIFSILNTIKKGCLGNWEDFYREWFAHGQKVEDPIALGTFLRDNHLFLRRTRAEVGKELPPTNVIHEEVECDDNQYTRVLDLAKLLAMKATMGPGNERGQASRELDIMVRQATGIAKAKGVAQYVRLFAENNDPVVLVGWHRGVYDIWLEELKDLNPVMYTGSETDKEKQEAFRKFTSGESNIFIISSRSGAGLDGLQERSKVIIFGELDWSPKIHEQLIGRLRRDVSDGKEPEQVMAIFLTCNEGSDPPMVELLGLKSSQSTSIVDPFAGAQPVFSDVSRLKLLAQLVLKR